jgi:hypothetical protein
MLTKNVCLLVLTLIVSQARKEETARAKQISLSRYIL